MTSERIVILAPSANDSTVAGQVLSDAGFSTLIVADINELCRALDVPVGALLLADEAIFGADISGLQSYLDRQDSWSDLPIILMASQVRMMPTEFFSSSGNISILQRPFHRDALIRSVDVALRARRKQYQVRDLMIQQERATRARDEFFATLSHELRTPLSVILGWIEVLQQGAFDPESVKKAVGILDRNARVQKDLIDDLLDISRIITGKMLFEFAPLDFGALLNTIVSGFELQAKVKGIALTLKVTSSPVYVSGDSRRLVQAISNLIANAIKFTPADGKVDVALENFGEKGCRLTVKDTGQGIEPSFLPSIFDRLKQEDMSSTRVHGGLGLGLAIASHIVEGHHGILTAASAGRNQGTTMTVEMPKLAGILPSAREEGLRASEPNLRGVRVLAIDDSHDVLELIKIFLNRAEAEVVTVDSANKALAALDQVKPDVILSDIGMPNMDGYQLIRAIRRRSADRGGLIPAVALTAYAREEERTRALGAGFQRHVSKPISKRELISAIATLSH